MFRTSTCIALAACGFLCALLPAQANCLLKDIQAGPTNSLPARFVDVFGITYFTAADPQRGHSLWKTDGTRNGTVVVKDFHPGPGGGVQPRELTPLGDRLVCYAEDGKHGAELWISDGTTQGTVMIRDINPGNQGRPVYMDPPTNLTPFRGRIFFSVRDGIHGRELWSTDGTAAGTALVKDIHKGSNYDDSHPSYLTPVGDTLFFFGYEKVHGWELWKSDGTAQGTRLVKDVWPGPEPGLITHNNFPFVVGVLGGTLFFAAPDAKHGYELWKSDGTTAGTVLVKDITPGKGHSRFNRNFTPAGGLLFFSARDGVNGMELWRTDGTTAGTVLVRDIHPGPADSSPGEMAAFGNKVLFGADDGVNGEELWISDGTRAGTVMLKDIRPGPAGSISYSRFYRIGSRYAWFTANDGRRGYELWRTDGTAAGTTLVRDIWSGSRGSYPEYLVLSGGRIIFRARDGASGQEPRLLFPGATAQTRGRGYMLGGRTATLAATDPVIGGRFDIHGRALSQARPLFLLAGFPAPPVPIAPGLDLHLDPTGPFLGLKSFRPVPTPAWRVSFSLPASPALLGLQFGLQAFQPMGGTPFGFDATPGVIMTAGP